MFDSWILGSRAPKGHFECADGRWIHNWVPNPRFILTASAGETLNATPDLKAQNDPDRFGTGPEELLVMMHYQPILAEAVRKFPAQAWVDAAATAGMTIQAVRPPEEALCDPLFLADGCVVEIDDPELGRVRQVGTTYRLHANPAPIHRPAPRSGEHTDAVRAEAARVHPAQSAVARGPVAGGAQPGEALAAPLAGITVLDLGLAIAGPYGTQILSDLGANVIKINALYDTYWHSNHIAYMANHGKRSIALNLKDPRAMKVLLALVARADVVQHNMRYDAAERLGIDYESLKKLNPRLVYCHTRGFETGPRAELPGNDQTGGCLAGVQYEDGGMARGGKPLWSFCSLGDTGNGFLSAIAIIQALYHRERTGEGQFCDTSIVNAQLLNTSYALARPDGSGLRPATRRRRSSSGSAPPTGFTRRPTAGFASLSPPTSTGTVSASRSGGRSWPPTRGSQRARLAQPTTRRSRRCSAKQFREVPAAAWFAKLDAASVPCEICDPGFALGLHDDAGVPSSRLDRDAPASLRRPAGPDRRRVRFLGDAGARAGSAADRRPAQPRIAGGAGLHPGRDRRALRRLRARVAAWRGPPARAQPVGSCEASGHHRMTDTPTRPDPVYTADAAFFWEGADRGELLCERCSGCARLRHPPRPMCPHCHSTERTAVALSGRGQVCSWIIQRHPAPVGFTEPPVVVLVDLEEGIRLVSNLEGIALADLRRGLPVEVAFAATRGGHSVPVFRPRERAR